MQFEAGARMILDAVLLTIADISLDAKEKLPVAIFPEMRISSGDGVLVKNAKNQFEVWLVGNVDYEICTYQYEGDRSTGHLVLMSNVAWMIFFRCGASIYARRPYDLCRKSYYVNRSET